MNYDDWKTSPPEEKEYDDDLFYEALCVVIGKRYKDRPWELLEFEPVLACLRKVFRTEVIELLEAREAEERAYAKGRGYYNEDYS